MGIDVIQVPKSKQGNRYAVVFVDYLTKWPEVFPIPDQTTLTIAQLFSEEIICRHKVPGELLSDRGPEFLSKLMLEVYELMGTEKLNTTAYHPQTDDLVKRVNCTLTEMLARMVGKCGEDWDTKLPYVLFTYRTSIQQSTCESPFFLIYGRDSRLPSEDILNVTPVRYPMDVENYKSELAKSMGEALELARQNITKAQRRQKVQHDK